MTDNTAEMPGISFSTLRFSKHTNVVHPQSETGKQRTVSRAKFLQGLSGTFRPFPPTPGGGNRPVAMIEIIDEFDTPERVPRAFRPFRPFRPVALAQVLNGLRMPKKSPGASVRRAAIVTDEFAILPFGERRLSGVGHLSILCASVSTGIRHNIAQERQRQEVLGVCTPARDYSCVPAGAALPWQGHRATRLSDAAWSNFGRRRVQLFLSSTLRQKPMGPAAQRRAASARLPKMAAVVAACCFMVTLEVGSPPGEEDVEQIRLAPCKMHAT